MSCKDTDFCGIPEDILDGIHPNEEDSEKVIAVDCCCKNSQKSAIISIDELMIKRDSEKRPPLIQKTLLSGVLEGLDTKTLLTRLPESLDPKTRGLELPFRCLELMSGGGQQGWGVGGE